MRTRINKILGLCMCVCSATMTAGADFHNGWTTNVAVLASTNESERPVLLYFTASWCGPCKLMAQTTFASPAVTNALERATRLALDIDQFPKLAEQHSVRAVPTFVLRIAGSEVTRATGYRDEAAFLEWFTNGLLRATEAAARRAVVRVQLAELDAAMASNAPDATRRATLTAFELLAAADPLGTESGVARLKVLAARAPAELAPGLNHPRLAVRLHIANILRDTLGERFTADPWADASERARDAVEWREQLSSPP